MRKIDILHLFVYLMIYIVISNWFINIVYFIVLQTVLIVMFWIFVDLIIYCSKLKKENKKLIGKK